ncbi:hypothetical protein J437_LFUL006940 [Ladona fulva]|uniref:Protein kinase domain-containing protein n=1 Tax=Ladona fulva TaxID=123851 RepID=A0A8K0K5Z5_LADFU|nr:hypothetical protein J437_LFUL006940 [Ladona fulva]
MRFRIIVDSLNKFQEETETGRALSRSNERYDETRGISAEGMYTSQGISLVYPLVLTVPENCAPYTRLAQPDVLPPIDYFLDAKLSPDNCPVGITPKSGILFVKDPSKLKINSTINIKVGGRGFNKDIHIIVNVTKSKAECAPKNRVTTCASAKLKRTCETLCGVGAPEYCVWRESTNAKGLFPTGFSTCSPNSKSCPDGFCDELEEEDHRICPQDCAHEVFGAVVQNEPHYNSGRGIKGATGVCTCDEFLKCSCVPEYKSNKGKSTVKAIAGYDKEDYINQQGVQPYNSDEPMKGCMTDFEKSSIADPGTKKEDNDTKTARDHFESCGESCLVAVALGVVAAFAIALTGAMYARRRKSAKQDNHELSSAVPITIHHDGGSEGIAAASLGTHSQIYGQDENGRMHQELPLLSIRPSQPYDPRWELPRNALKIDETLGEGEFGMVFKGKLKCTEDPSSCDEYMTVAVKTLKEDAGEMERHALASEFNLLQGVNHVNVVKLIGACTYPKSLPFLLIIEFAAMGSLRYIEKLISLKFSFTLYPLYCLNILCTQYFAE